MDERTATDANGGGRLFENIVSMRMDRDGTATTRLTNGTERTSHLGQPVFAPGSAIAQSTFLPHSSHLHIETTTGDHIVLDLPLPWALAPIDGRPIVYLDQNHWSTIAKMIHEPHRVPNADERNAATQIIALAMSRKIILPMSSGHMAETCKWTDDQRRYQLAVAMYQLGAGWQLRDPLDVRRFELRQALTTSCKQYCPLPRANVTLEPDALNSARDRNLPDPSPDLPPEARWFVHALRCAGGNLDAMLDGDPVAMDPTPGWVAKMQQLTDFLAADLSGPELKRRRTTLAFIADLGRELPESAYESGITPEEMSDWTMNHSDRAISEMPSLGLFREVMHEKLCEPSGRWEQNDLQDMMYLTCAAGYCDHVVGERHHTSHMENGLRRLGRTVNVYRSLRALVQHL